MWNALHHRCAAFFNFSSFPVRKNLRGPAVFLFLLLSISTFVPVFSQRPPRQNPAQSPDQNQDQNTEETPSRTEERLRQHQASSRPSSPQNPNGSPPNQNQNPAQQNSRQNQNPTQNPPGRQPAENENDQDFELRARLVLGDGRTLSGKIRLRAPERFTIRHTRQGVQYNKPVQMRDIRAIEMIKWSGKELRQNRSGSVYEFDVSEFKITFADNTSVVVSGELFTFFKSFSFENSNGRVTLYTYWMDLLQKDGQWYTGLDGPASRRTACHKDAVKKISFTTED